jgi:hypothetical protein
MLFERKEVFRKLELLMLLEDELRELNEEPREPPPEPRPPLPCPASAMPQSASPKPIATRLAVSRNILNSLADLTAVCLSFEYPGASSVCFLLGDAHDTLLIAAGNQTGHDD